jgi:dTDP-4-dehydrorhamnose 3,5-epimerase-like enzyme/dTDP-4-dehydrorhamnose reductase
MNNSFIDKRGKLLFPIKNNNFNFNECSVSINHKNVFRGIHINQFDKLVTCVSGKILDIIINFNKDEEDYLIPKYYNLDPNTELFEVLVKKNHGHAFLSLDDNSIIVYHFNGHFVDNDTKSIHYLDPFINLVLPIKNPIISDKDNIKNFVKTIDYVVLGSTGFLGSNMIKYLKLENKNYITTNLRLQNTEEISNFLDIYQPKYVINCAGLTGTPNIYWCDDHKIETIETNITYQLTLAKICFDKNIHLTIFGSGGIFNNDRFYNETDEGNFKNNFYSESRIYLENIIKNYTNVLYLRINYPISSDKSNKNLLTKLLTYKNIESVELSITYIDNLYPILIKMIETNENGICNFINPGSIKLADILNIYNNFKDHQFNIIEPLNNNRSIPLLECNKLNKYNPMFIRDAIKLCCTEYISKNNPVNYCFS